VIVADRAAKASPGPGCVAAPTRRSPWIARVEGVAITSEGPQGAAERRRLLEHRDDVAEVREIHGRGEASDPAPPPTT
jgi:hypothetical protein